MSARNATIFRIQDRYLQISDPFETAEFWCIVSLRTILRLLQSKNSTCSFYCCLVKNGSALKVALQFAIRGLFVYKTSVYQLIK